MMNLVKTDLISINRDQKKKLSKLKRLKQRIKYICICTNCCRDANVDIDISPKLSFI